MGKIIGFLRLIIMKPFLNKCGSLSYLMKPCYVSGLKRISLGQKVRIYPGARIESLGGDIHIDDDVSIGQNLHLISKSKVFIGPKTTISSNVFISDVNHEYEKIDTHIMYQELKISNTIIGSNCFIGVGSTILPGTKLGKQNIVGANSVVRGIFPDYCVIAGSPGKIIKRYDEVTNKWIKVDE